MKTEAKDWVCYPNGAESARFLHVQAARIALLGSATTACSRNFSRTPPSLHPDYRNQPYTPHFLHASYYTMAKPKRAVLATIDSTVTPPDSLPPGHALARITRAEGKNIYAAELPDGKPVLAELEARFRSTVWIKRGSYVVVDMTALADRENKLDGEIVNVVRDEKAWRKMSYWYACIWVS